MKNIKTKERSMKKIMIKLIIKTVIIITMTGMIYTCFVPRYIYEDDLPDILDLPKVEIITKVTIQPFVLKDPCELEIYTLSNKTIEQFIKKTSKKFTIEWFEKRKTWKKTEWNKTPIDTVYNELFELSLTWESFCDKRLSKEFEKIEKAARREGSFYALYESSPFRICFVLLNISDHKLYINHLN